MVYRVIRDNEIVAEVDTASYTDTTAQSGKDYVYRIENWQGAVGGAAEIEVEAPGPPAVHTIVTNRAIAWSDLPTKEPDNGSLTLVDQQVRDGVPAWVDTRSGETVVDMSVGDGLPEYYQIRTGTRATYTYEWDADWDNIGAAAKTNYIVDVLGFKDNRIASGYSAFLAVPAVTFTAITKLDTSGLTAMNSMFHNAARWNGDVSNFETSACENFSDMFNEAVAFNGDISGWSLASIQYESRLARILSEARAFTQDLSGWCVEHLNKPADNWCEGSGIAGSTEKHPKWGQPC